MAISEACQLWIEQRVEEELEGGNKSYRAIGKELAMEIERIFKTKISPNTLYQKARRQAGTNVPPPVTPENNTEIKEIQVDHGGQREGAGRKPKYTEPELSEEWKVEMTQLLSRFQRVMESIEYLSGMPEWSHQKTTAINLAQNLVYFINDRG